MMTNEPSEKKRTPLESFLYHQGRALEETGKAFVSLLPKEFREHAGMAAEETAAGFEALANAMLDGVEDLVDWVRPAAGDEESGKDKIKVDVE